MNKGRILSGLLVVIIFMAAICRPAGAQGSTFYTQEQLTDLLSSQKPEAFEFTCSGELYAELSEHDFRGLFRLLARAGIDYNAADVAYNGLRHFIGLSSLSYPALPWEECSSLEDVRRAVEKLAREDTDFILLCSDELLARLIGEQHYLSLYTARSGIKSHATAYSTQTGILKVTEISRFDKPYTTVDDYAQFSAAVSYFSARGINDFYIIFDPELFAAITSDPAEMTTMTGSGKLSGYSAGIDMNSCVFHFYNAEFTDAPREICRSLDDVSEAIRRMGAVGISDFELIFPYTEVFDALYAGDFALLLEIRTAAGMVRSDISYSSAHDRIIFSNSEIVPDVTALAALSEAVTYTEKQIAAGSRDIHLFCSAKLYRALMGERDINGSPLSDSARIYDLLPHAGIFDYDITTSDATHLINIRINRLFPGTAILMAARSGDRSGLSERELRTWEAASVIAASAQSDDPLQTARSIHDWLCDHVSYIDDEFTDEDDNAVGAILNGHANCDGYSDAFFLIGGLAGLNVRYQHGDSLDQHDSAGQTQVSHLWNLLELDGEWHMVDVTWDDEEDGPAYIWFNIGSDTASRTHLWNADMTVPIAAETRRPFSIGSDFYVSSEAELWSAVDAARNGRLSDFRIIFTDPTLARLEGETRQAVMNRSAGNSLRYTWNEKLSVLGFYGVSW